MAIMYSGIWLNIPMQKPNILRQETIDKFGYDPEIKIFKPTSQKKVVCKCPSCGKIRDLAFEVCERICIRCSNIINSSKSTTKILLEERSKRVKEYWKNHKHPMLGIKHSDTSKKKMSDNMKGRKAWNKGLHTSVGKDNPFYGKKHKESSKRYGKNNAMFGRTPCHTKKYWYKTKEGKDVCFRSGWEFKVASYLDQHNILWTYECDVIPLEYLWEGKLKESTYRPDFFLPELKKFIEVKGLWYNGYKEKFDAAVLVSPYPIELWDRQILIDKGIL